MFHLDNNSGISAMPKPAAQQSSATRWFTEGGGNNSPSWPGQDWFNIVQAELLNVLAAAGIAPEKTAFNQLALAIKAIINKDALLKDNLLSEIRTAGASFQKTARENLDITDATLNKKGLTQLSNAVDSTSETQSATPKAVKIAMDNANARLAKDRNGADIPNVALFLQNLGLEDLAKTSENNTFTGKQTFKGGVSLPADTAFKGIGLQAWLDSKQEKDDTLTALSGKDVAGLLLYLGLNSVAKTDAQNTFTRKQTFSGSVALPSDTTLNGTGLEYLFDSKLDASKALGTGQTWVNVTASRTAGVTYTNSTTRPICVSIPETGDGDRGLYVGGVLTAFVRGTDSDSTLFAIVPPGAQYIFSGAFSSWAELR